MTDQEKDYRVRCDDKIRFFDDGVECITIDARTGRVWLREPAYLDAGAAMFWRAVFEHRGTIVDDDDVAALYDSLSIALGLPEPAATAQELVDHAAKLRSDHDAMAANLGEVQARCTELYEENRELRAAAAFPAGLTVSAPLPHIPLRPRNGDGR